MAKSNLITLRTVRLPAPLLRSGLWMVATGTARTVLSDGCTCTCAVPAPPPVPAPAPVPGDSVPVPVQLVTHRTCTRSTYCHRAVAGGPARADRLLKRLKYYSHARNSCTRDQQVALVFLFGYFGLGFAKEPASFIITRLQSPVGFPHSSSTSIARASHRTRDKKA